MKYDDFVKLNYNLKSRIWDVYFMSDKDIEIESVDCHYDHIIVYYSFFGDKEYRYIERENNPEVYDKIMSVFKGV